MVIWPMRLGPTATEELLDIYGQCNGSIKKAARLYVERQGPRYPLTQEDIYYILHETLTEIRTVARRLLEAGIVDHIDDSYHRFVCGGQE